MFFLGRWYDMTIITICLAGIFYAVWKAPHVIRPIGNIALAWGLLSMCTSACDSLADIEIAGGIALDVLVRALRYILITPIYGILVYAVAQLMILIKTYKN